MLLRKINAVISLLTVFFLLDHVIFNSILMFSRGKIEHSASVAPWILTGLMALHAVISIYFAFAGHKGAEKRKCKGYPQMNRVTLFQRISGILLIVFAALHIAGASGAMRTPYVIHMIVPPIFFTLALAHVAFSTDKAFITLGIGNARAVKAVSVIIKMICAVALIAAIVGFYLYAA